MTTSIPIECGVIYGFGDGNGSGHGDWIMDGGGVVSYEQPWA